MQFTEYAEYADKKRNSTDFLVYKRESRRVNNGAQLHHFFAAIPDFLIEPQREFDVTAP